MRKYMSDNSRNVWWGAMLAMQECADDVLGVRRQGSVLNVGNYESQATKISFSVNYRRRF